MITKSTIYETPGGYELRVDMEGNVSLTEPQPVSRLSNAKATVLDMAPEDISEIAAMFYIAAREHGGEE